jgi:branched-chain amino acid transport system substrate-binding protein
MAKVRKLVETDKVALIVGPVHSACAAAIAPYLAKMDVPGLAPSRHGKSIPLESKSIWLTAGLLGQLSYAMGIYAYEELGYRTATTLAADYVAGWEYNEGFVRGFEDSGGKVIQKQWYPLGTLDLMPYIINVEDADVFAFWGCGGTQISALRQFKEQELWKRMPIVLSSWCGFGAPAMLKEEGDTAVGIITETGWDSCIDVPGSEEFAKAFKDKFDELPDAYAGLAYVAMQIAFDAIERTGGDTSYEALAKALDETDMDTIRGHVVFTPDRVAICSCFIIQCEKMVGEEHILKHLATYTVSADRVYDDFVYKLVK